MKYTNGLSDAAAEILPGTVSAKRRFTILGQGTAVPEHFAVRDETAKFVIDYFARDEREKRMVPMLYRMSGVTKRHSCILTAPNGEDSNRRYTLMHEPKDPSDKGPTIGPRMRKYEECSVPLAVESSGKALDEAGISGSDITHVVTVSCSGFSAPGVDVQLIKELGIPRTAERVHVGFMGCHGALNGLRTARGFAESNPDAVILLCAVELCSVHYHYGWDPDQIVANALFADGSAAVVGTGQPEGDSWQLAATGSCLIPDSEDAMTWRIGDNGFNMSLSPKVPALIEEHLRPWLSEWLAKSDKTLDDIKTWAVHPGGPKILTSAASALGLEKDALAVSRDILRNYGNMSSPTILFILDRLRREQAETPCVALAFGPGLMAEAVLFE